MSSDRIRPRILAIMTLAVILLLAAFLVWSSANMESYNDSKLLVHIEATKKGLDAFLTKDAEMMHAALTPILEDEQFKTLFEKRDRVELLARALPLFEKFFTDQRITHFYFTSPDRVNFLRVHKPEQHGDRIDRFTMLEAHGRGSRPRASNWGRSVRSP